MRAFSLLKVLGALLLVDSAVAEPIPIHAKAQIETGSSITKRVSDQLFGQTGNGAHYWAWARVPYDGDWNSNEKSRKLRHSKVKDKKGNMVDRDWVYLSGDNIDIQGTAGEPLYDAGFFRKTVKTSMNAIVAVDHTHKDIVIAFKGTDDITTAMQDAKYATTEIHGIPGTVHLGFGQCFQSVQSIVERWLREHRARTDFGNYNIVFVGHSLGGATAHIAASFFTDKWNDMKDQTWVFTYGAPRAGNLPFQKNLETKLGKRMFNFRHQHDPVTMMPWISAGFANPASRYVFKPVSEDDSWADKNKYEHIAAADEGKAGWKEPVEDLAAMAYHKMGYHTGYYDDEKVELKRGLEGDRVVGRHHKRQAPTLNELARADGSIVRLDQNADLRHPPQDPPRALENLARFLHVNARKVWKYVKAEDNETHRMAYLMLLRTFAEEQG